ncbi:glycosyltransferase family 9 protein [bacterium]|nr:glycosyltransferase family 9 protein [bacterium]MBU1650599.1 glycosyltransferase family 9 protein [bacterium]MBU1881452.1 glycosyltransferase family 9 protein [bacterium]
MAKALVIALARFGDLLQSFPAISDLHRTSGGHEIALLVPDDLVSLAKLHRCVDEIIPFDGDELLHIMRLDQAAVQQGVASLVPLFEAIETYQPDVIVNLTHTRFSGVLAASFPDIPVRGRLIQRNDDEILEPHWTRYFFSLLESRSCNGFNLVDLNRKIASDQCSAFEDIDISADHQRHVAEIIPAAAQRIRIAVAMGANHPLRQWPVPSWKETIRLLASEMSAQVVLVGTKSEIADAQSISDVVGNVVVNLCGQTDPAQLAAVIDSCDIFIGQDSGPLHLAALLGKPCVGLYLAMASAWDTAPYTSHGVTIEPDLDCHPCSESGSCNNPICHAVVTPEIVLHSIRHLLTEANLQPVADVSIKNTVFDPSGCLTLAGQPKKGDQLRLFWRTALQGLFPSTGTVPGFNKNVNAEIISQYRDNITILEKKLLEAVQQSMGRLQEQLDRGDYQDTLSSEIFSLADEFSSFRPLFDLYRIECFNSSAEYFSPIEKALAAQENLLQRLTRIQRLLINYTAIRDNQPEFALYNDAINA